MLNRLMSFSVAAMAASLVACGGGSSSTPPASGPASLEITGVAATGAALPNASISAKCAAGTGSANAGADGSYKLTIVGGSLPCVVRAISTDTKIVLHSAIEGSGAGKVNVNVSPMTELVVGEAQNGAPAALFDQFDANKAKLTQTILDEAKARVRQALTSVVDLSNTDPIKDALVAAALGVPGNSLDQKLDKLRDALAASGLKLSDLSALMATNLGASVSEIVKVTLQPVSSACKGFRSGTFRVIEPANSTQVYDITFNASTLVAVTPQGTVQLSAVGCMLTAPDNTKIAIAPSGLGVMRTALNTLAVVMPKQNLTVNDLAGQWFWVDRTLNKTTSALGNYQVGWGQTSFDASGKATAAKECKAGVACADLPATGLPQLVSRTDGGFDVQGGGIAGQRMYGFRAPSGAVGVVSVATGDASFMVARRGEAVGLPTLGDVYSRYDIGVSTSNVVDTAFFNQQFTVTQVDASKNTFSRKRTSDCRVDSFTIASPFPQAFERVAGTSKACDGVTVINYPPVVGAGVAGLGLAPYVIPSTNTLGVSIAIE